MRALRLLLAAMAFVSGVVGVFFWSAVARARLFAHGARIGPGLRVRGPLRLHCHRTGSIRIGQACRIQSGFAGNAVGGEGRMEIWVGPGASLAIGDGVGLSNSTIVCAESVRIEDGAVVGGGARVYDTNFHSLHAHERSRPRNPGARTAPVVVGREAFVGGHCIILKGVRVGSGSVVGAGSVIRSDVPDGQVWAGNPARFVRSLGPSTRGSRPTSRMELVP